MIPTVLNDIWIFSSKFTFAVVAFRLLQLSLNESVIRITETPSVLQMVSYNPAGRVLSWRFVRSHWNVLYER